MELDIKTVGNRIKNRRKELNLTQLEIKEKTGISSGNMSDIERGNRLPAASTLVQLSEILQCSIDWILTGKSPIQENSKTSDIDDFERILLELYRELSDEDKEDIEMLVQLKAKRKMRKEGQRNSSTAKTENTVKEFV